MLCTFCGAENRSENKFCGLCGVRLERRKIERRMQGNVINLRCGSCGNINDPGYKFCGMCGTRIERRLTERRGTEPRANATANVGLPAPDLSERRRSASAVQVAQPSGGDVLFQHDRPEPLPKTERSEHGITGPSFLGLSSEPENEGDYLLEDEGSSRRGLRTLVLLAVLAAIIGLIFVQWRSSYRANPKSPEVPKTEPSPGPQGTNQPPGAASASPEAPQTQAAAQNPAAVHDPFSDNGKQLLEQAFGARAAVSSPDKASSDASRDDAPVADHDPAPPPPEKGVADLRPSKMLMKAQQYIQGTGGMAQNCEQGLVYLRAAAQKNEPAAAVQMGALYASGQCVKQDRVMAYRWFNSAHELQPSNQWIQRNMDHLWGEMNAQERRQARY